MFGSLFNFRRPAASRNASRRARKPGFEGLEGRQLMSLGAEFLVNSITQGTQTGAVTASSANGASVVAWINYSNGSPTIEAQRFNAQGAKVGSEMHVYGQPGVSTTQPAVAMDANGDFVVAWTESFAGHATDVLAQKFNASGGAVNGLVPVGTGTFPQSQPSVGMDGNGDFVVAYTRETNNTTNNVFAKVYNTNSQLLSVESVGGTQFVEQSASVAMAPNGNFDVAFVYELGGGKDQVYATRFNFNGSEVGQYPISPYGVLVDSPSIGMDNQGNAMIAYQQFDGNNWDVFARRLSNSSIMSQTFTVAATSANETAPSVSVAPQGAVFVVAYESNVNANITEMTTSGSAISTQTAGSSRFGPNVSINGQNRLLMAYTVETANDSNIAGRFGSL